MPAASRILARCKKQASKPTTTAARKEVAYIERLVSNADYREGYQDALKEPTHGLKHRFIQVLEKRPEVAGDILKGRYFLTKKGKSQIDLAAAERDAGTPSSSTGETALLEKRLAEDAPEFLERYHTGEFPSIRQAAIAAGIHNDTHSPLTRLKANWNKASAKERRKFKKWLTAP